jgi:hypothetical protein
MRTGVARGGQTFYHITGATGAILEGLLLRGAPISKVPISRIPGDRAAGIPSSLRGVLVSRLPGSAFNLLPHLTSNYLPIALRIETTATCPIIANDSFVHDEFILAPQPAMEAALKAQADFVLGLYGTTVLAVPAAPEATAGGEIEPANNWKITGMQIFDDCLLRHHDSPPLIKQRKQLLEVMQLAYFQQLLRVPLTHEIARSVEEQAAQLIAEHPFVPFDEEHVTALFDRCGWTRGASTDNSPNSVPILTEPELTGLRSASQAVQTYMTSCPEPVGHKPPSFDTAEPERSDKFDEYVKAKYLKKPPPPPPVTFGADPNRVKMNPNKKFKIENKEFQDARNKLDPKFEQKKYNNAKKNEARKAKTIKGKRKEENHLLWKNTRDNVNR